MLSNVRTLLATCGSEEIPRFEYPSRTYFYYLPSVEPHVASNVRYIAFSMRTNSVLTRCKQRAVRYSPQCTNTLPKDCDVSKEFVLIGCELRKRSVFILYFTHPHLFNENKLRTHTLQARCGTFTLLLIPSI